MSEKNNGHAGNVAAATALTNTEHTAAQGSTVSDEPEARPVVVPPDPAIHAALGGAYAVVTVRPGDKYRRRLFFSLQSAQRLANRARARGEHVHLAVVRLVPSGEVLPS